MPSTTFRRKTTSPFHSFTDIVRFATPGRTSASSVSSW